MSLVFNIFHFSLCSIKLTTYGIVKRLITASEKEFQTITEENRNKHKNTNNQWYWTSNSYCFSQFFPWIFVESMLVTLLLINICGYYFRLYLRGVKMIIHLSMLLHPLAENFVGYIFLLCAMYCCILLMNSLWAVIFGGCFTWRKNMKKCYLQTLHFTFHIWHICWY